VSDVRYVNGFSVIAEIAVNNGPIGGIAATADGSRLITTNGNSVSVIDTRTCAVVQTITGIEEPFAVAMAAADGDRAYVNTASAAYDAVAVIDLRAAAVVGMHPLAFNVTDLAVSPDAKHVFASRTEGERADIAIVDTTTHDVDVVEIAATPGVTAQHARISADGQRLYVAANGPYDGRLVVIGACERRIIGSIQIGSPIRDVALSHDGSTAYVASCGTDFSAVVDVIDIRTSMVTSTAKVLGIGRFVTQLALSRDGDRAYLVSDSGVTVLSIYEQEIIGAIAAKTQPSCVIESPDGRRLYVADYSGSVTVASIASPIVQAADEDITAGLPQRLMLEPALT
jgi:YVTN family beta-propeller protein